MRNPSILGAVQDFDRGYVHEFVQRSNGGSRDIIRQNIPTIVTGAIFYVDNVGKVMNLTLSAVTAVIVVRRGRENGTTPGWVLLALSLLVTLATAYITLNLLAYVLWDTPTSSKYTIARQYVFVIQAALGDSVTIWRCYVFYDRKLPALLVRTQLISLSLRDVLRQRSPLRSLAQHRLDMGCDNHNLHYLLHWLFAVIFFVIETSMIYTLGIVAFLITTYTVPGVSDLLTAMIVHLPPIVLCLLILQIKFCNKEGSTMRDTADSEPATVESWTVFCRVFRTGRKAPVDGRVSTFQAAPIVLESMHTAPSDPHAPDADYVEGQREKRVRNPIVIDVV
ncbi:hypothetical protein DENSPDRAFT_848698 [Dentipellis sp. KUC8613]|nr:hypothetical protein DENSPDRAFT_848698 [Dentipellis sp. KUC8613]